MQNFNSFLKSKLSGNNHEFTAKVEIYDMTGGVEREIAPEQSLPVIRGDWRRVSYDTVQPIPLNKICPVRINNKIINFQTLAGVTSDFGTHQVFSDHAPSVGLGYLISEDEGETWSSPLSVPNITFPQGTYSATQTYNPFKYHPVYHNGKIYFFYSWAGSTKLMDLGYTDSNVNNTNTQLISEIRCKILGENNGVLTQEADIRIMQYEYVFTAYSLNNKLYITYHDNMDVITQEFDTNTNTLNTDIQGVITDFPELVNLESAVNSDTVVLAAACNDNRTASKGRTYFFSSSDAQEWDMTVYINYHVSNLLYSPLDGQFYALCKYRNGGYLILKSQTASKYWGSLENYGVKMEETYIHASDHKMVVEGGRVFVYYISSSTNNLGVKRSSRVTYTDSRDTILVADIPEQRIRYVEWDYTIGEGVSRTAKIELSNTDEYFSKNGIDAITGIPYSAIFSFYSRLNFVNKKVVLKIGDNQVSTLENRYETVFTGILVNHTIDGSSVHLECEDMLYLAKKAGVEEQQYEGIDATYLVGQLFDMAGVPAYELSPFVIQVDNLNIDSRSTVLDNVLEILKVSGAKMYCDRFGVVRTLDLVPKGNPVMSLTDDDFFPYPTRTGPSAGDAINRVKVYIDSQVEDEDDQPRFIVVENKEAQKQMRRIVTMELDCTPMFKSGLIPESKAREIGEKYLEAGCRTTMRLSGQIKAYFWLDVYDIIHISISRPYTADVFFAETLRASIGFHSDNLNYNFDATFIDS